MTLTSPGFAGNQRLQQAGDNNPAMRKRETGDAVGILQQALIDVGFQMPISTGNGAKAPDGIYGDETAGTVLKFQRREQLQADGVAGRQTLGRLDELLQGPAPGSDVTVKIEGPFRVPQANAPPQARLAFALGDPAAGGQGQSLQLAPRPARPPVTDLAITRKPEMPLMIFRANVRGADPLVVFQTQFDWVLDIRFNASACRNGPARSINKTFRQSDTGGSIIPILPASVIRGGSLTVSVSATINGKVIRDRISGFRIVGTNPTRAELFAALPNNTLRRMALQESGGGKQFAAANGGVSPCPLWSGDRLGGVGIFQITLPPPTDDEVWNWRANVAGGLRIFGQKLAKARGYPAEVRRSAGFQQLVKAFNANRRTRGLPPLAITLPEFTTGDFDNNLQQLELDAIRGFNGFAGSDGFGHGLHEFRVAVRQGRLLVANIDPQANTGEAVWERVPAAQRPQDTGDPNYVPNVLRQRL